MYRQLLLQFLANPFETLHLFSGWSEDMHIVLFRILKLFFLHFNLDIFSSLYATDMYREYMPCIGNPAYSFRPILLKLYRYFEDGLKMCIFSFQNPEVIFNDFCAFLT